MSEVKNQWWYYKLKHWEYLSYGSGVEYEHLLYGIASHRKMDRFQLSSLEVGFMKSEQPATTEQIERILGGYARQMGYVGGTVIKSFFFDTSELDDSDGVRFEDEHLYAGNCAVFNTNTLKWAEIVKPEEKSQAEIAYAEHNEFKGGVARDVKIEEGEGHQSRRIKMSDIYDHAWTCPVCNSGVRGDIDYCNHENESN
jgi:hypothetical protein